MTRSDGVVLASPVYSFQVSAHMKAFLDRLGFMFHRPRFHGKACTSIVVEGIYGGRAVVKYLDFVGAGLGFNVVKGSRIVCRKNPDTAQEPMRDEERRKMDEVLARQSQAIPRAADASRRFPNPRCFSSSGSGWPERASSWSSLRTGGTTRITVTTAGSSPTTTTRRSSAR